jgi:galactokinase
MAAAVDLDIIAVAACNADNVIRVKSKGFSGMDEVDITRLAPRADEQGRSIALVRGVAAGIAEAGGKVGGVDIYTVSNVLRGSGLSSSAAFEVVLGAVLNGEFNAGQFSAIKIAQISQYAENVFFGKPSGLMDQMACSVGSAITIDFKDAAAPVVDKVPFDLARYGYALCITDTKGSHADLTPDYAAVRGEMEAVAAFFGKQVLREVEEEAFYHNLPAVREKTGDRAVLRAIHFFQECRRAGRLCDAVREGRFEDFLQLITEGGHSSFEYNQNAYSTKHPEQQGVPLGLALSQRVLAGQGAWRLQGGGFAGTIQAFVPHGLLGQYQSVLEGVFGQGACYVLNIRNYGGIQVQEHL